MHLCLLTTKEFLKLVELQQLKFQMSTISSLLRQWVNKVLAGYTGQINAQKTQQIILFLKQSILFGCKFQK